MNTLRLVAPFIIVSFLISLLLLTGRIDQDFFAYYYVGRAVIWGRDMFADVAESKGPVTYLFFAALYWLFGRNYTPSIILASTLLDAVNGILLFSLAQRWLHWKVTSGTWRYWGIAAALIIYIKSFSINSLQGGVYPEQVALPLILLSLLLTEKRSFLAAGISFGLGILARQSFVYYIFFICVRMILIHPQQRKVGIITFQAGTGIVIGAMGSILWYSGQEYWAFENMVLSVMWYSRAIVAQYWQTVTVTVFREFRLLFSMIFVIFFLLKSWNTLKKNKILLTVLGLLIAGAGSVFTGALVWDHHFLQLSPLFVICFIAAVIYMRSDYLLWYVGSITICCVFIGYAEYVIIGSRLGYRLTDVIPIVPEIGQKRYLVAQPFQPRLYIDFDKESPDRYYNPGFSLDPHFFGGNANVARVRHLAMNKEKIQDTAFVFISDANRPVPPRQRYLDSVREPFGLEKTAEYIFGLLRIEIYGSSK